MHKKASESETSIDELQEQIARELFDLPRTHRAPRQPSAPLVLHDVIERYGSVKKEPWDERMLRMLRPMAKTCASCTICELGRSFADDAHPSTKLEFDPHVFSNMKPSRWMVVGQNPGQNECLKGEPFVGQSGERFNEEIRKHGLTRDKFYITNAVKCYTRGNERPSNHYIQSCKPFLEIEFRLMRPRLVVALGSVAFNVLCPELKLTENMGNVVKSKEFEVKVYPIYHPSPMNLSNKNKLARFQEDVARLCKIIKKLDP